MSIKVFKMKNFIFSFVIICATLLLFQAYNNSVNVEVAEFSHLDDEVSVKGVVVKDEYVLGAKCNGTMKYFCEDGEKVIKGKMIAELYTNDSSESIRNEIDQINMAISSLNANEGIGTNGELNQLAGDIQQSVLNSDIQGVYNNYNTTVQDIDSSADNKYNGYSLDELNKFKEDYTKALENNKITYYAPVAGLVSPYIDGYESVLAYSKVLDITPNIISNILKSEAENENKDTENMDNHIKVTRNFKYYIACKVSNDNVQLFSEEKYVRVRFDVDDKEQTIYGWIEKINHGSEESVIIISFDDFFYMVNDKRIIDVGLITDTYEGLEISKKSIITKDGVEGVYIKDISNIIKFFPIQILGSNDKIAIISQGEVNKDGSRGTIIINDEVYSTVKIFDKVVLNPDKVYEGQIAN